MEDCSLIFRYTLVVSRLSARDFCSNDNHGRFYPAELGLLGPFFVLSLSFRVLASRWLRSSRRIYYKYVALFVMVTVNFDSLLTWELCFLTVQSALFNFESFLTVVLLVICTCTYVKIHFPKVLERKTGYVTRYMVFVTFAAVEICSLCGFRSMLRRVVGYCTWKGLLWDSVQVQPSNVSVVSFPNTGSEGFSGRQPELVCRSKSYWNLHEFAA